ncbi:MAG: hypothetical protein IH608_01805 [Proteobacteria bacterium]|nr:hypothetical protein [Pseudomonadota bacterium]
MPLQKGLPPVKHEIQEPPDGLKELDRALVELAAPSRSDLSPGSAGSAKP